MKKKCNLCLLALVIGFAFLLQNCQEEDSIILEESQIPTELSSKPVKDKLDVCHYNAVTNTWYLLSLNNKAITAHLLHGDVIIDKDGDGYAAFNECGILNSEGIDCEDANSSINPSAEEICGDGIDNDCNGKIDDCGTYVPDDNFEQALIDLGYDDVIDDYVLTENINSVTELIVFQNGIKNLTGIEDFKALTTLNCGGNQISSLDVSGATALTALICDNNQLTSINVSGATALTALICNNNQLTSINVNNATALKYLYCYFNKLTNLDVSSLTSLTTLYCSSNLLTSIDISGATSLIGLDCSNNQLTSLDISGANNLDLLYCYSNPTLSCIQVNSSQLTSIPYQWFKDATASYSENCGY